MTALDLELLRKTAGDASVSYGRRDADARAVHLVTTRVIELFADTAATRDWLEAMAPGNPGGRRYG